MDDKKSLSSVPVLVSDFDGTMTQFDFFRLAQQRLVPSNTPDYWEDYLAGRLTHFGTLQRIFAAIRASEDDVMAAAHLMNLFADVAKEVRRLQTAGWKIVLASAGCDWYITRLLSSVGIDVTVHANPATFDPEQGLLMRLPTYSPYLDESTGISKEAVVRDMLRRHQCVAFAGDGRPDLPAAMLVPPERRFARGWLAEQLHADGIPFHAYANWSEIADILLEGVGQC